MCIQLSFCPFGIRANFAERSKYSYINVCTNANIRQYNLDMQMQNGI